MPIPENESSTVIVVLKGYPRLSETFIAQELLALEQRGLNLSLVSLRHPTDKSTHPVHEEISAPVNYLPEYLYQEPLRVLKSWWKVRHRPGVKICAGILPRTAFDASVRHLCSQRKCRKPRRRFTPISCIRPPLSPATQV